MVLTMSSSLVTHHVGMPKLGEKTIGMKKDAYVVVEKVAHSVLELMTISRNQKVHSFVSCFYLWMPKTNPPYGAAGFEPEGNTYGLQAQNQPRHTEDSFLVIGAMN